MKTRSIFILLLTLTVAGFAPGNAGAQETFVPQSGQPGKDVVWVPTPAVLVEKMLDLAKVTPQDYVMDLGSGDGRNIIAAAKRGATAVGVEYNPEMVELSRRLAKEAGVAGKATFIEGDMYEADISKATVMALFLLPVNLDKMKDKFLALKPGTRIVLNTFSFSGWESDVSEYVDSECDSWCTAILLIVPAQAAGTWKFSSGGEFTLTQQFQKVSGTISDGALKGDISEGRLRGTEITFTVGDTKYTGQVDGNRMTGTSTTGKQQRKWTATRTPQPKPIQ